MDEYALSLHSSINCIEEQKKDGINGLFIGGLFIGDILSRKDERVDAIISLGDQKLMSTAKKVTEYPFLLRDAEDEDEDDINEILDCTMNIITRERNKGKNVLVHCEMGISRSATVVLNYLMTSHNMSFEEAVSRLRKIRFCIKPIPLFERVLRTRHNTQCDIIIEIKHAVR